MNFDNGHDRPRPRRPSATRESKGSDIPTWQLWVVGFLAVVLIGVPIFIVWAKFVIWLLGL